MMMSENYYLTCLTDSRLKAILKSGQLPHLVFTSEIQLTSMSVSQPHLEKAESSTGRLLLWFISTPSVSGPLWTFTLKNLASPSIHPTVFTSAEVWRLAWLQTSAPYCLCSMHPKQYGRSLDGILQALSSQSWNS